MRKVLMIDPLVLSGGKRIFRDEGVPRPLRLVDSQVTTTGAILVFPPPLAGEGRVGAYIAQGPIETGSVRPWALSISGWTSASVRA